MDIALLSGIVNKINIRVVYYLMEIGLILTFFRKSIKI